MTIKDGEYDVVLSHYPMYEWPKWHKGAIHLHGHTHQNIGRSFRPRAFDVGVDGWDYKPVSLNKILKSQEIVTCEECMHYKVCKYCDKFNRQQCIICSE